MKKIVLLIGIIAVGIASFMIFQNEHAVPDEQIACTQEAKVCSDGSAVGRIGPSCEFAPCPDAVTPTQDNGIVDEQKTESDNPTNVSVPLDRTDKRVTKKPFRIFITPKDSPVQPEKFRGYHTGTDFEAFSEEQKIDIAVRAVCPGTIAVKRSATGYGGVVVARCELGGEPVTVVYGHLVLASVTAAVGDSVEKGDILGTLGASGSTDTDLERKHLHLGIHRGEVIDIRGYVAEQQMLDQWLDPCEFFCK
ncbi:MAG: M23 family metallopeptidase [Candidatus Moraniibacteriota bacterium]